MRRGLTIEPINELSVADQKVASCAFSEWRMLPIFEERVNQLRGLVDALVHWTLKDYFIPHMIQHQKSASFVPDRMAEILTNLYDDNVSSFTQSVRDEVDRLEWVVDNAEPDREQSKITAKRQSTKAMHSWSEIQERCEMLSKQRSEIKQQSDLAIRPLAKQINAANTEIRALRTAARPVQVSVEAIELQIQNGRRFINELSKAQASEVQQIKQTLVTTNWRARSRGFARSLRNGYALMKRRNEKDLAAICEIRRLLGDTNPNVHTNARWLVLHAIDSAKERSCLSGIRDQLQLPESSTVSSESLANDLSKMVKARVEEKERDLRRRIEESRRREEDLRRRLGSPWSNRRGETPNKPGIESGPS
jgi:hypothetical protein